MPPSDEAVNKSNPVEILWITKSKTSREISGGFDYPNLGLMKAQLTEAHPQNH